MSFSRLLFGPRRAPSSLQHVRNSGLASPDLLQCRRGLSIQERAFVSRPSTIQREFARFRNHQSMPIQVRMVTSAAAPDMTAYKSSTVRNVMSLEGRTTVITGGARGIGLALARTVAELGGNVAVLDSLETPHPDFWELEKDFGVTAKVYKTDVTSYGALVKAFESVVTDFGSIDSCITAAGIVLDKPFLEHGFEESVRIQMVNTAGTFFSAQLAAKQMSLQKNGGSIVMIASITAHCAVPSQRLSAYGASKGAVLCLGKHLAVELAPLNIRVNTISPGYIATDLTGALLIQYPEYATVFNEEPPMKRMGDRKDLKGAVAYLLSDAAAYTTGADILVTGGLHAGRI